jgi:TolB-like protein/DNA-binding winged helix-turn-helix (wHTH) protein/Tfp pilus assembly protein PilF
MLTQAKQVYEFGPYRLVPAERQLLRDGKAVALTPKAFDLLLVLVEHSGCLVEKDELLKQIWPDSFVEEANLSVNMTRLRRALGEDDHRYIETVPKRGYRFIAGVRDVTDADLFVGEEHTRAPITTEVQEAADHEESAVAEHPQTAVTASGRIDDIQPTSGQSGFRFSSIASNRKRAAMLAITMTGIAAAIVTYNYFARASRTAAVDSLAVLPFANEAGDQEMEYLSDGLTESIIYNLSQLENLKVKSRNSVFRYKGREVDAQAAGRELGAQAVLTGRVAQRGDKVLISVELVDVRDGNTLWGERYDRRLADLPAVQGTISHDVSERLRPQIANERQRRPARDYTQNAEAYQLYLRGRYFWNKRTAEAIRKGMGYFQQAIEADPQYALAYAGLADSHVMIATFHSSTNPAEELLKAKEAALKALEIDNTLAEAHASLGFVRYWYEWDWTGSEAEYKRATELSPNYAMAHHWYALLLASLGRFDPAIAEIVRAEELEPSSLMTRVIHGWILAFARRNDEAIEQYEKTFEMDPNFPRGHIALAQLYTQKGMVDQSVAELLKVQSEPRANALKKAYETAGSRAFCRKELEFLRSDVKQRYVPSSFFADWYVWLDEKDQAFAWLEKAYAEHDGWLVYLKVEPRYDRLRSDPRFTDLLRRMNLAP